MKRILFIFILISAALTINAQTDFVDLPTKSVTAAADSFVVVNSGITYRMAYSDLINSTVAGSQGQLQYNNAGALGASTEMFYDGDVIMFGSTGTSYQSGDPVLVVNKDRTGTGNAHCFVDESELDKSGNAGYNSFDSRLFIEGTEDYDHLLGFQAAATYNSSGTVARYMGFGFVPKITGGTATEAVGLMLFPSASGGTIDAYYGVHSAGTITSGTVNYFLNSQGTTPSYLGGNL